MAKISSILRNVEGDGLMFICPGCKSAHVIYYGPGKWSWNGDVDKPTFSPSVLVRSGHYAQPEQKDCWCTYNDRHPENPCSFKCGICHSFVVDGNIQFLSDSTHELAGQTVPIPPIHD